MARVKIVCPKCGGKFDRPRMDIKLNDGLGLTFPGTGLIKCPQCGYKDKRREFAVSDDAEK